MLILGKSINNTFALCTKKCSNIKLSLSTHTTWTRRALQLGRLAGQRGSLTERYTSKSRLSSLFKIAIVSG